MRVSVTETRIYRWWHCQYTVSNMALLPPTESQDILGTPPRGWPMSNKSHQLFVGRSNMAHVFMLGQPASYYNVFMALSMVGERHGGISVENHRQTSLPIVPTLNSLKRQWMPLVCHFFRFEHWYWIKKTWQHILKTTDSKTRQKLEHDRYLDKVDISHCRYHNKTDITTRQLWRAV